MDCILNARQLCSDLDTKKISAVKSLYKYLNKTQLIDVNPAANVVLPKIGKRLPKVVRKEHMDKLDLRSYSADMGFSEMRDWMIVELLYQTGMRRSELIGLMDEDIDFIRGELKVIGKGNKERVLPISADLLRILKDYLIKRNQALTLDHSSF